MLGPFCCLGPKYSAYMPEKVDTTHVLMENELVLYKRDHSKVWQCRFKVDGTWPRATTKQHEIAKAVFHRILGSARLELTIEERFGNPVQPREWFMVPLHVIDEPVQRIIDGSIFGFHCNSSEAKLTS